MKKPIRFNLKNNKTVYTLLGLILGFGAPVGLLLLRASNLHVPFSLSWANKEITKYTVFYWYMTVTTPVVFAMFGFAVGYLLDRQFFQKLSLESSNFALKEQSIIDELTGFYNRRHILTEIEKEVERARRYKHTMVGIMIDVDDFKKFNDKYGHLVGDYVLREVAAIFDHSIRTIDILGRYGGDEFIIILPEAGLDTGRIVAERIRNTIKKHEFKAGKKPLKVTVSIGIHYFEDLAEIDKFSFIEKIDKSLFLAKEHGKNRAHSSHDPHKKPDHA